MVCLCAKTSLRANLSYENEFDLHENGHVGETNFHKNSFALRLVLTLRQTRTRKWAILLPLISHALDFFSGETFHTNFVFGRQTLLSRTFLL